MDAATLFERILVGVDDGGLAADAVAQASALARELGSDLRLVHAVDIARPQWVQLTEAELETFHATAHWKAVELLDERELAERLGSALPHHVGEWIAAEVARQLPLYQIGYPAERVASESSATVPAGLEGGRLGRRVLAPAARALAARARPRAGHRALPELRPLERRRA